MGCRRIVENNIIVSYNVITNTETPIHNILDLEYTCRVYTDIRLRYLNFIHKVEIIFLLSSLKQINQQFHVPNIIYLRI